MTSPLTSPEPPKSPPIRRRWFWPLHGATCGAIVTTTAVLLLANIPGQKVLHPDIHATGKYGPHWEGCTPYYEHGWPLTYLKREVYSPELWNGVSWRSIERSPWDFATSGEEDFRTAALVNGLSAGGVLAVVFVGFQLWFGRRQSVWQFRLVDLFAAVALASAGMAWYVWNRQDHDREIQLISTIAEKKWGRAVPVTELSREYEVQPGGPTFLRQLIGDQPFLAFDRVIQCYLLSEESPAYARQLRYLRVFGANGSVTSELGRHLADMPGIEALDFCLTSIEPGSQEGTTVLADFPAMPRLRCINLYGTAIQDADLAWLAHCESLEMIDLTDTDISAAGIERLKNLKRLTILSISGPQVSDETCVQLGEFPELNELWISSSGITDAGAGYLARSPRLSKLVWDAPLADEGLLRLASVEPLVELSVSGTKLTDDGIAAFRSKMPSCTLWIDGRQVP